MSYLIFRGVSTLDIGVLVAEMPAHAKPGVRYNEWQIAGRDGTLRTEEGYNAFNLSCRLTGFRNDAYVRDMINAWADGEGLLISSDMPDRAWKAAVLGEVKYTRRMYGWRCYDLAQVTFRCQPGMREAVPSVHTFERTGTILNPGTMTARPQIVVTGSGTCVFSVGGNAVTLDNVSAPVTLDCDAGYVYTEAGAAEMVGDFPVLPLGQSDVVLGRGVTKIEIQPNWRWL